MRASRIETVRKTHTPTIKDQNHMKKLLASWKIVPVVALFGISTACSDVSTTAPVMSTPRADIFTMTQTLTQTVTGDTKINQASLGDTVLTVFRLGLNTNAGASIPLGFSSKIEFPYQIGSICDPLVSTYGPGTWNSACVPLTRNITITAKTWLNAKGKLVTDFEPALRFVPGLPRSVTLQLKDPAVLGTRIDYCNLGVCTDESLTDPSLRTQLDPNNKFVTRIIRHFSGYTITADRTESDSTETEQP